MWTIYRVYIIVYINAKLPTNNSAEFESQDMT